MSVCVYVCMVSFMGMCIRGVPIIRSAKISATDMVMFTNIGIGTE